MNQPLTVVYYSVFFAALEAIRLPSEVCSTVITKPLAFLGEYALSPLLKKWSE